MDIATLVGILVSFGLVIVSILMGGEGTWFVSAPSLMIVGGGTMGATLLAYPLVDVLGVFKVAKNVFMHKSQVVSELIPLISEFAKKARQEGILSFESQLGDIEDPFLVQGIQMAIDGMESSAIEDVMTTEIIYLEERHRLGSEIFSTMGTFAPAVGMLGTIIGLVQMLMLMEDPSQIGAPMALALLTTFYGTLVANLVFLPIAGKLKTRSKQEILIKQMVLEGVISIQSGDNHRIVEQKLKAFIAPRARVASGTQMAGA
ncbi:MAG: motility protein A [Deltaproteobacteria bacterium]|nr:motility protein A [Deltaproteobacteria bacterium]MBW2582492.1 motility protein A [Deltaproteobacteria bacterium]